MLQSGAQVKTAIQDGMQIQFDLPIRMDDGVVLRADVYGQSDGGRYPVILSHGPYAKGLAFQEGYRVQWEKMVAGSAPARERQSGGLPGDHLTEEET